MLAEDKCQAESAERAASIDCGTVGKRSPTDYRSEIMITAVAGRDFPESTDLQVILTIHRIALPGLVRCISKNSEVTFNPK